jgi:serine/threonine-protein kinase
LTGRPPFRAETTAATLQQVLADDPVPPAQLNPRVPRDLETICLKCLEKDPRRRYPTAAALADDLRRFDNGEPISARPAGRLERAVKWVRRRPATAVLLAAGVLMFVGVIAAAVWYVDHRARLRAEQEWRGAQVNREANAALAQAEIHLKGLRARLDDPSAVRELLSDIDHWQGLVEHAREDWRRAESATVGNEAVLAEETRARIQAIEAVVDREQAAYELAKDLDNIAIEAFASADMRRSPERRALAEYERLFARQGLDVRQPGTDWFKSAIGSSPSRFALLNALDTWAFLTYLTKDPQLVRLLELARAADPDPWRDRFRDPAVWADGAALTRLAKEVDVGRQSPMVLVLLGKLLRVNEADPTVLWERAVLYHPRDFRLLLYAALDSMPTERRNAVGLAVAAVAVRPRNALAYSALSYRLWTRGDWPEALVAAERAVELDPKCASAYVYLGVALQDKGDLDGVVAAFQKAAELSPDYPADRCLAWLLATCPDDKGRDGKRAVEHARTACERTGWKDPLCLDTLAAAYAEVGQFKEAVRYQTRALEDPALTDGLRTAARQRLELYRQKKPFRNKLR